MGKTIWNSPKIFKIRALKEYGNHITKYRSRRNEINVSKRYLLSFVQWSTTHNSWEYKWPKMYQLISKFQKVVYTDRIQFRHRKYEIPWFTTVWITHYIKWNKTSIKEYFFLKTLNFKNYFHTIQNWLPHLFQIPKFVATDANSFCVRGWTLCPFPLLHDEIFFFGLNLYMSYACSHGRCEFIYECVYLVLEFFLKRYKIQIRCEFI